MVAKKCQLSRRRFLVGTACGLVAPYFVNSRVLGAAGEVPPSDRVVTAVIGCGGRGMGLLNIQHCANRMHLESRVGVGTRLEMWFDVPSPQMQSNGGKE
jgi:hypothetical protein